MKFYIESIIATVMRRIMMFGVLLFGVVLFLQNDYDVLSQLNTIQNKIESSKFDTLVTNSINLSDPVYQAYSGTFLGSTNLTSSPNLITKDRVIENAFMRNIGNVTNNMTFINTHLPDGTIQATAYGTITSDDGQSINWISSDIGAINGNNEMFHGIIQFNSTDSSSFSFLNNAIAIDKQTPDIKRTMWLVEK
ncbi:MAG TPA: hypothetical protein VFT71_05980 [Candidatus Nitrosocosmicus sp.]|nr:hypothetical protein [Candidatus Nitrosocosmicus sp.]